MTASWWRPASPNGTPATALSGQAPAASSRPLTAVLAAIGRGASSLADVAAATGLPRDAVEVAVDQLVRLGRLATEDLAFGCPATGCGGCPSAASGAPGCGAQGPSGRGRGPVLVTLRTP
jgi:hypothetical protein